MYAKGKGVQQNHVTAVFWFQKAAEHGDGIAQTNLGYAYREGLGVPQDYARAMSWYRRAAENAELYGLMGPGKCSAIMYERGQGAPQDYVQAHMWFNLAAARGKRDA